MVWERTSLCSRTEKGATDSEKAASAKMFAEVGVRIHWRIHWRIDRPSGGQPERGPEIVVSFMEHTPHNYRPGRLGYANLYKGHITVFWDRIQESPGAPPVVVLAHMLVHEITHILQGIDRHSDTGVMKACWTASDYADMVSAPLPFTSQDIQLILLGLAARARGETLVGADSGASEQGAQSTSGSNGLSELRTLIWPQMNTD